MAAKGRSIALKLELENSMQKKTRRTHPRSRSAEPKAKARSADGRGRQWTWPLMNVADESILGSPYLGKLPSIFRSSALAAFDLVQPALV